MPPQGPPEPRQMAFYFALAQVGLEMVFPIVGGVILDQYLATAPWGVLGGVVLGFVGGLAHLVILVNRHGNNGAGPSDKKE